MKACMPHGLPAQPDSIYVSHVSHGTKHFIIHSDLHTPLAMKQFFDTRPLVEGLRLVKARAEQHYRPPRVKKTAVALTPPIKRSAFEAVAADGWKIINERLQGDNTRREVPPSGRQRPPPPRQAVATVEQAASKATHPPRRRLGFSVLDTVESPPAGNSASGSPATSPRATGGAPRPLHTKVVGVLSPRVGEMHAKAGSSGTAQSGQVGGAAFPAQPGAWGGPPVLSEAGDGATQSTFVPAKAERWGALGVQAQTSNIVG